MIDCVAATVDARPVGRRAGVALAVGAGLAMAASLPPMGFWPLAVVGVALLDRAVADAPPWARFRRGTLAGIALLAPTTWWIQALSVPGYLLASPILAALLGTALAACPPGRGRWLALPGLWVVFEAVRGRWPFGGVPLSVLAQGQVAGPLAGLARVGGSLLLGGATVALGVALAAAAARRPRPVVAALSGVAALAALAGVAPSGRPTGDVLAVAVVQGGGPQGTLADETDPRDVFERHVAATALINGPVDLIVWPENVVNVDGAVLEQREGRELAALAEVQGAVLVAGVFETFPDENRNAVLAFDGTGEGGEGLAVARFEKIRRVPFGEFVPLRSALEPVAEALPGAGLPAIDSVVGEPPATLDTPAGTLGVVISWEVFFADRAADAIGNGGEVLLNPTNGSSYTGTQVQSQQVASSRLRAIETGRWVVQAAPTGFSAIVTPGGDVVERTGVSEQRVLQGTVARRDGLTWAVRFGPWPAVGGAAVLVAAGWLIAARTRNRGAGAHAAESDRPVDTAVGA
jgi:apolipoprotein N-acyltransferase